MKKVITLFLVLSSMQVSASANCFYALSQIADHCSLSGGPSYDFPSCGSEPVVFCSHDFIGTNEDGIDYRCYHTETMNIVESYRICPGGLNPSIQDSGTPRYSNKECGSIVNVDSQVLSETVPITGTSYSLVYSSNKVKGYKKDYSLRIPIIGDNYWYDPQHSGMKLEYSIAGQYYTHTFSPVPGTFHHFTWNGLDHLGNPVLGSESIIIKTTLEFTNPYDVAIPREYSTHLGSTVRDRVSFKGWDIDVRHIYDESKKILYKGNGNFFKTDFYEKSDGTKIILSEDRSEYYIFDSTFTHIETRDFITAKLKLSFSYNTSGKLISISDAYSNATSIQYYSGVISSITSPFGLVTSIVTDSNERITSISNTLSEVFSMTYDTDDLLLTFLKPNGNLSTFTYNSLGLMTTDQNSEGSEINLDVTIGNNSRFITNTSALGIVKTIESIVSGESYKRIINYPNYSIEEYEESGNSVTIRRNGFEKSLNSVNDLRFSSKFRVPASEVTLSNSQIKTVLINETATLLSSDPFDFSIYKKSLTDGSDINELEYDALLGILTRTSSEGRLLTLKLNSYGSIIEGKIGNLLPVEATYNSFGQNITQKQGSREITYEYSLTSGELIKVINPLLEETEYTYDSVGKLASIKLPDMRVIGLNYDFEGNLTGITPPGKPSHSLTYNGLGRLQSYIPPTIGLPGSTTNYSYNADRKIASVLRPSGESITFGYDTYTGDLTSILAPSGTKYFNYFSGDLGQASSEGAWGYYYYIQGFNYAENISTPTFSYTLTRSLNSKHLLEAEDLYLGPYAINLYYAYDGDNLLVQSGPLSISRDPELGVVTNLSSEDVEVELSYSSSYGELSGVKSIYNSSVNTYETTYTRDVLGRISTLIEKYQSASPVSFEYIYDSAGRLTEVKEGGITTQVYGYDSNSNRNTQTIGSIITNATYDDQDRLLTFGAKSFTYNANGEMLTETEGASTKSFTYDAFGNLKTVVLPTKTVHYLVDAFDRRVARLEGTVNTDHYIWNGNKMMSTVDGAGVLTAHFIYGSKSHVPDYMITDTAEYMIVTNHLGSPVQVIDVNSGVIVQEIKYTVWGEIISDTNPGFQPFGFAGCLYDQDTKLCRFGARDYDPSIGRWLSKDPILFNGGDANLYGYVLQDPVNLIDPSGLSGIIGGGSTYPIINPGLHFGFPNSGQPSVWEKLAYVNNEIDYINSEKSKCIGNSNRTDELNKKESVLFDQLIDTILGGSSLDFIGKPVL